MDRGQTRREARRFADAAGRLEEVCRETGLLLKRGEAGALASRAPE